MNSIYISEVIKDITTRILGASHHVDMIISESLIDERTIAIVDGISEAVQLVDSRIPLRCILQAKNKSPNMLLNVFGIAEETSKATLQPNRLGPGVWGILVTNHPGQSFIVVDGSVVMLLTRAKFETHLEGPIINDAIASFDHRWQILTETQATGAELLYEDEIITVDPSAHKKVVTLSNKDWERVLRHLRDTPEKLRSMNPRDFEELVAELLDRDGFSVQLTPPSRDKGRDILATRDSRLGRHLYYVECKRYAKDYPVGVTLVRSLYGVAEQGRATAGILVTTSRFTKGALEFAEPVKNKLSLKDYKEVVKWIRDECS